MIGLRAIKPDAAVVKVMSVPDNRCVRVVIPDNNIGTDGFHEILIHDMADADAPDVPVSELGCLGLDWLKAIFSYMGRYQVDLENLRHECPERFGSVQSGLCTHCGKYIRGDLGWHWRCPVTWCTVCGVRHRTVLTDWFRGNKLSLNVAKTNYMLFSHHISSDESLELKMADQNIFQTNCSKFLGIHIDDKLKWNIHIDKVKSHISSSLFAINKIKHFAPKRIMKTLYYSMVYPYLIYGITLWGATYKFSVNKLTVMQKKVIRAMVSDDLFNELGHTNSQYQIKHKIQNITTK